MNVCKEKKRQNQKHLIKTELRKLDALGRNSRMNIKDQSLVPNFFVSTEQGFDSNHLMSKICSILNKYNMHPFNGTSEYIEIIISDLMLDNPGLAEEILAARFIQATEMCYCFQGIGVLNFHYKNTSVSAEFIKMLSAFITSVNAEIKFVILVTKDKTDKEWMKSLMRTVHFEEIQINCLIKRDLVEYAMNLLKERELILSDESYSICKQYIELLIDNADEINKDSIETLINKVSYAQLVSGHTRFIDKDTLLTSLNEYSKIILSDIEKDNEIGFRG